MFGLIVPYATGVRPVAIPRAAHGMGVIMVLAARAVACARRTGPRGQQHVPVDTVSPRRVGQVARVTSIRPHHQVAAGVLIRHNRVLLCHRRSDLAWYPGVWDLVGGHVEPGEVADQALVRECREELAIEIGVPGLVTRITSVGLDLTVFLVPTWIGEPVNAAPEEHQGIGWFSASQIPDLALADPRLSPLLREILEGT